MNQAEIFKLKPYLESFLKDFDHERHIRHDPVFFVHQYENPRDQEVVALLASCLAYGRVEKILEFLGSLFKQMGHSPYEFILNFDLKKDRQKFHTFTYRFHRGRHIACFIYLLKQALQTCGSLEKIFLESYSSQNPDMQKALSVFVEKILGGDVCPFYSSGKLPQRSPVRYFLPSPDLESTCKRLNLFLRWMIRGPDKVDFGIWKNVRPAHLMIPLDTHVARICRYLGLSNLTSASWKAAYEITQNLRLLDSEDPVKYDFAICHLGISGDCPSLQDWAKCEPCQLRPVCRCWI